MSGKGMLSGLILEGTRFEGSLQFENKMRIDGEFKGKITSKSQLIVGKSAKIDADIKVQEVVVMGEIRGTIAECENLEIQNGGRVLADIRVKTLDIKPGAIFEGNCVMLDASNQKNAGGK